MGMASFLLAATATAYGAPVTQTAHATQSAHNQAAWRLFAGGPFTLLTLICFLAMVAVIAAGLGRLEGLTGLGTRAARRLEQGFVVPTLWGICALLVIFALTAVLFATKVLGFLGLIVILLAFCFTGLGTAVAGAVYGRGLAVNLGSLETDDLANMRLGLWILFLASVIPFVGWLFVFLAVAGGLGAVLQSLSTKKE
jgi:hypothetical protein